MMTRSKTRHQLRNEAERLAPPIPLDLIIEIFSRLPVKSIARFRCLSKIFASTLRNPDFTKSFFAISSSRPKLLFTCQKDGETFFFSSPLPQTPSPIAVTIHMSYSGFGMRRPVRGLACGLNQKITKGETVTVPLICNPSTGQSLSLPRLRTRRNVVINHLGYDPIDNQFKVWCIAVAYLRRPDSVYHQILTLRTGKKLVWRMIKCDIPHYPYRNGNSRYEAIYINGVLYYLAKVYHESPDIVSFDVRSEKFSFIKKPGQYEALNFGGNLESTLVNYKGKLALLHPNVVDGLVRPRRMVTGIQLWVLEDAEKHEWSRFLYILPPPLKNVIEETNLCFVGTTDTGEIVMSPDTISDSFFLIYYNPEKNTITRVEIRGMEAFKFHRAYTFLDHVEDVNLNLVSNL